MTAHHNHSATTLYHITEHDCGEEAFWYPKDNGVHRTSWEPKTPRICFSTSITGCFLALGHIACQYKKWHLYSTLGRYYQPTEQEVVDSGITQEVWRLEPTSLKRIHCFSYIERHKIQDNLYFTVGNNTSIKYQKKFKPKLDKIIKEIFNDKTRT